MVMTTVNETHGRLFPRSSLRSSLRPCCRLSLDDGATNATASAAIRPGPDPPRLGRQPGLMRNTLAIRS